MELSDKTIFHLHGFLSLHFLYFCFLSALLGPNWLEFHTAIFKVVLWVSTRASALLIFSVPPSGHSLLFCNLFCILGGWPTRLMSIGSLASWLASHHHEMGKEEGWEFVVFILLVSSLQGHRCSLSVLLWLKVTSADCSLWVWVNLKNLQLLLTLGVLLSLKFSSMVCWGRCSRLITRSQDLVMPIFSLFLVRGLHLDSLNAAMWEYLHLRNWQMV